MRFTALAALTMAGFALGNPAMVSKIQALEAPFGQISQYMTSWNGGIPSMLLMVVPAAVDGAKVLRYSNDITRIAKSSAPLNDEEADEVLKALESVHQYRDKLATQAIETKPKILGLNELFGDLALFTIKAASAPIVDSHEAILEKLPAHKQAAAKEFLKGVNSSFGRMNDAYSS